MSVFQAECKSGNVHDNTRCNWQDWQMDESVAAAKAKMHAQEHGHKVYVNSVIMVRVYDHEKGMEFPCLRCGMATRRCENCGGCLTHFRHSHPER